jgi:hypothetical protein
MSIIDEIGKIGSKHWAFIWSLLSISSLGFLILVVFFSDNLQNYDALKTLVFSFLGGYIISCPFMILLAVDKDKKSDLDVAAMGSMVAFIVSFIAIAPSYYLQLTFRYFVLIVASIWALLSLLVAISNKKDKKRKKGDKNE